MSVKFNNEIIELNNNSLLKVLIERGYHQAYYAVAVNQSFIPRALHEQTLLQQGDVIEIISPMQGG
ncbi:MAG: thiamine biosynthesis protein ThiS [Gammaproteobacteria bacterium RIFCSPHIGHO2_12_FULL_37_14]|nr:MAG: thiamine biosynthesis protein ThiS [Gammaproteobacteria bacterium RIFCSPHIGHO2_12_FULL_37_14]